MGGYSGRAGPTRSPPTVSTSTSAWAWSRPRSSAVFRGERGSCQYWIDDCMSLREREEKKIKMPPIKVSPWNRATYLQRLCDNLSPTRTGHANQILITPDWRMILIDHSRSFRTSGKFTKSLIYTARAPKGPKLMSELPRTVVEKIKVTIRRIRVRRRRIPDRRRDQHHARPPRPHPGRDRQAHQNQRGGQSAVLSSEVGILSQAIFSALLLKNGKYLILKVYLQRR